MLIIWTIYDHPSDFPDSFVARKFIGYEPTKEILVAGTLQETRKIIQNLAGKQHRIARSSDDDPKIVESWL